MTGKKGMRGIALIIVISINFHPAHAIVPDKAASKLSEDDIAGLVMKLGDDDYGVRSSAQETLEKEGEPHLELLKSLKGKSGDLEVEDRLKKVIERLVLERELRELQSKSEDVSTEVKKVQKRLETTPVAFDYTGIPIDDLFKFLQERAGVAIVLDPSLSGKARNSPVTLALPAEANLTVDDALKWVVRAKDMSYQIIEPGFVYIGEKEGLLRYKTYARGNIDLDKKWKKDIYNKLVKTPVAFDYTGIPFNELLKFLQARAGVAIILDPKLSRMLDKPITLSLAPDAGFTVFTALNLLTAPYGMRWVLKDGVVFVTTISVAEIKKEEKARKAKERQVSTIEEFKNNQVRKKMTATKVALASKSTPFEDVIAFLAEQAKVKMVIDPELKDLFKSPVTLSFPKSAGINVMKALDWTVRTKDLTWEIKDGEVFIKDRDR